MDAKITCKHFLLGRLDASKKLPVRKQDQSDEEYKQYLIGYSGYKVFTDKKDGIMNTNLNWPKFARDNYSEKYNINHLKKNPLHVEIASKKIVKK
jgi:hypothetical protein